MQTILGISHQQMRFSSLEDAISADNQVRFIDAFVTFIDLPKHPKYKTIFKLSKMLKSLVASVVRSAILADCDILIY